MQHEFRTQSTLPPLSVDRGPWFAVPIIIVAAVTGLAGALMGNVTLFISAAGAAAIATMVAIVLALVASKMRTTLCRLVEGEHFLHWRFDGVQWEYDVGAQNRRRFQLTRVAIAFVAGCIVVVFIALWVEADYLFSRWLAALSTEPFRELVRTSSIFFATLIGSALFSDAAYAVRDPMLSRAGGYAYIGPEAVYFCGSLRWLNDCRSATWVDGDPPNLCLVFGRGRVSQTFRIPILEEGREGEAHEVLAKVQQICAMKQT